MNRRWVIFLYHLVFWSWNIIFFAFIYFGLIPKIGFDIWHGIIFETINYDFVAFFIVVLFLPIVAAFIGFIKLRKAPKKLAKMLYGFELPLLLLMLFRILFLRDITSGAAHFLILFAIGSLFLIYNVFKDDDYGPWERWLVHAGNSIFLLCGVWVALILLFFIPPSVWYLLLFLKEIILNIGNFSFMGLLSSLPNFFFIVFGFIFFIFSASLFVFFPFAYVYWSFDTWKNGWNGFHLTKYKHIALFLTIGLLLLNTAIYWQINDQNHAKVLKNMEEFNDTKLSKIEFVRKKDGIKKNLVNIYLAPYRYLGDEAKTNNIQSLYANTFDTHMESTTWMQYLFNQVAAPWIYRGSGKGMREDQRMAEELYETFFDNSIQEVERETIRHALQATYSRDQREAGLININQKRVHIEKQEIQIEEHGEWADLEIHETYANQYNTPEEVSYHFYLPDGAVVTGLWLSENEEKKYKYTVASRGAAQKVYKEIVAQGSDPALVEQVGPHLYRLRIFPIPGNDLSKDKTRKMHMWLKIKLLRQMDKGWELPKLTEKRNVYWDNKTDFIVDDSQISKKDSWLPEYMPYKSASEAGVYSGVIDGHEIMALPNATGMQAKPLKIAILLEKSFSMNDNRKQIISVTEQIKTDNSNRHTYEFFLVDDQIKKIDPLGKPAIENLLFFGNMDVQELMNHISGDDQMAAYDHLIVLTDKSLFKEKKREFKCNSFPVPTWFLMVDGKYPRVSGDDVMKFFQENGGGIEGDFKVLMRHMSANELIKTDPFLFSSDLRYNWYMRDQMDKPQEHSNEFNPFAAEKYIRYQMTKRENETEIWLKKVHHIAITNEIVTPYSSMIVLVNEIQDKMLEAAEKNANCFDREVENGIENLVSPLSPLGVSAVPEPEEWALLMVIVCFLIYYVYQKYNCFRSKFHFNACFWLSRL